MAEEGHPAGPLPDDLDPVPALPGPLDRLDDGVLQEVARLLPPASLRSLSATCRRLQRIADHLVNSLDLPLSLLSEPGFSKAGGAALARALARRFRGTSDMQVNLYFNSALHPHECQEAFRVLGQHLPVQRLWLHDACTWWMPLSYSALQPLVPNLKELHVMLQGSPELEAAAVMAFERSVGHIAQLTSLESLRVRWMLGASAYFDMRLLEHAWVRNLPLRVLELGWVHLTESCLENVLHLPQLESLILYGDMSRLSAGHLAQMLLLGSLRKLVKVELVHRFADVVVPDNLEGGVAGAVTAGYRSLHSMVKLAQANAALLSPNSSQPLPDLVLPPAPLPPLPGGQGTGMEAATAVAHWWKGLHGRPGPDQAAWDKAIAAWSDAGLAAPIQHCMVPVAPLTVAFAGVLPLMRKSLRQLFLQQLDGAPDVTPEIVQNLADHGVGLTNLQLDAPAITPGLLQAISGLAPSLERLVVFNGTWQCTQQPEDLPAELGGGPGAGAGVPAALAAPQPAWHLPPLLPPAPAPPQPPAPAPAPVQPLAAAAQPPAHAAAGPAAAVPGNLGPGHGPGPYMLQQMPHAVQVMAQQLLAQAAAAQQAAAQHAAAAAAAQQAAGIQAAGAQAAGPGQGPGQAQGPGAVQAGLVGFLLYPLNAQHAHAAAAAAAAAGGNALPQGPQAQAQLPAQGNQQGPQNQNLAQPPFLPGQPIHLAVHVHNAHAAAMAQNQQPHLMQLGGGQAGAQAQGQGQVPAGQVPAIAALPAPGPGAAAGAGQGAGPAGMQAPMLLLGPGQHGQGQAAPMFVPIQASNAAAAVATAAGGGGAGAGVGGVGVGAGNAAPAAPAAPHAPGLQAPGGGAAAAAPPPAGAGAGVGAGAGAGAGAEAGLHAAWQAAVQAGAGNPGDVPIIALPQWDGAAAQGAPGGPHAAAGAAAAGPGPGPAAAGVLQGALAAAPPAAEDVNAQGLAAGAGPQGQGQVHAQGLAQGQALPQGQAQGHIRVQGQGHMLGQGIAHEQPQQLVLGAGLVDQAEDDGEESSSASSDGEEEEAEEAPLPLLALLENHFAAAEAGAAGAAAAPAAGAQAGLAGGALAQWQPVQQHQQPQAVVHLQGQGQEGDAGAPGGLGIQPGGGPGPLHAYHHAHHHNHQQQPHNQQQLQPPQLVVATESEDEESGSGGGGESGGSEQEEAVVVGMVQQEEEEQEAGAAAGEEGGGGAGGDNLGEDIEQEGEGVGAEDAPAQDDNAQAMDIDGGVEGIGGMPGPGLGLGAAPNAAQPQQPPVQHPQQGPSNPQHQQQQQPEQQQRRARAYSQAIRPPPAALQMLCELKSLQTLCLDLGHGPAVLLGDSSLSCLADLPSLRSLHFTSAHPVDGHDARNGFSALTRLTSLSICLSTTLAYPSAPGWTYRRRPYQLVMDQLPNSLVALCAHGVELVWSQPAVAFEGAGAKAHGSSGEGQQGRSQQGLAQAGQGQVEAGGGEGSSPPRKRQRSEAALSSHQEPRQQEAGGPSRSEVQVQGQEQGQGQQAAGPSTSAAGAGAAAQGVQGQSSHANGQQQQQQQQQGAPAPLGVPPGLRHLWLSYSSLPEGVGVTDFARSLPTGLETLVVRSTPCPSISIDNNELAPQDQPPAAAAAGLLGAEEARCEAQRHAWPAAVGRFKQLRSLGLSASHYQRDLRQLRGLAQLRHLILGYTESPEDVAAVNGHLASRWLLFHEDLMAAAEHMPQLRSLLLPNEAATHVDMLAWMAQLQQVAPCVCIRVLNLDHIWKLQTPCGVPDTAECLEWWTWSAWNTL